jgi:low affinity Fe/Cu permease
MHFTQIFDRFAKKMAQVLGHPLAFCAALAIIILWALSGPLFHFSDTWQLVINTSTTIITFLMVFLIQNTQNRDSEAMQIKLDEVIRSMKRADNSILGSENLTEKELHELREHYERLAKQAQEKLKGTQSQKRQT